jgi:predicted RecA/RadA family phage recombinase
MADYAPLFQPGQAITLTASAAVTGGQLVEITTDKSIQPAGAASAKVIGVALYDGNVGDLIAVQSAGVQRLTASGAIAAGDSIQAAANGQVATVSSTNPVIGIAIAAAASGATALVKLNR